MKNKYNKYNPKNRQMAFGYEFKDSAERLIGFSHAWESDGELNKLFDNELSNLKRKIEAYERLNMLDSVL